MTRVVLAISLMALLVSCGTTRVPIQYLEQEFDTAAYKNVVWRDLTFKTGDIISIEVKSDNMDAAALYNQGGGFSATATTTGGATKSAGATTTSGYLVNKNGMITMNGIGQLKVGGKTKEEVADMVVKELVDRDLLKNPTAEVRLLNFTVTISGEVKVPGEKVFSGDRVNLLQALAQAGDFDKGARRDIVNIIRERDGQRSFARLNLNEAQIFKSPYFQLEQNDVVMVPSKFKRDREKDEVIFRYVSLGFGAVNLIAFLITVF